MLIHSKNIISQVQNLEVTNWPSSYETRGRLKFVLCPVRVVNKFLGHGCAELGRTWVFLDIFTQCGPRLSGTMIILLCSPSFERAPNYSQIPGFWGTYLRFIGVWAPGGRSLQTYIPEAQLERSNLPNGKPDRYMMTSLTTSTSELIFWNNLATLGSFSSLHRHISFCFLKWPLRDFFKKKYRRTAVRWNASCTLECGPETLRKVVY